MPRASLNVKRQISNVIKKFKFEELESSVLPVFPELSWSRIKNTLVKNHESLTTAHALRILEEEINNVNVSENILKDRLGTLEVIDVSRHYKRKVWYGYELRGTSNQESMTLGQIQQRIKQGFDVYHMEMDVQAVLHNGIIFVSVKDRPKKKQIRAILPTYFSLLLNEKFFFCSKRVVLKNILMAVTDGLGYQSCKQIKLMGKDIKSLTQMLLNRKLAEEQGELVKPPLKFRQAPPVLTTLGLDFTQHKQRMQYANKCFGDNPPTFEFLRVKSLDQKWKHKDAADKLSNEVLYTGIEFRSTSIPNFLKILVTQRILMTPLPCYAANILSLGRNDFTVKENQSSEIFLHNKD